MNKNTRKETAKGGQGLVFMKSESIQAVVGPFELKLGQFEAKCVGQAIYNSFDDIWRHA